MRTGFAMLLVIAMMGALFSQPGISYMQLTPSLISDNADTDCQAIITSSGAGAVTVRYFIWGTNGSRERPVYSGNAECIGESWGSGRVCHSGYFNPRPLFGAVICRLEASDGENLIGKNAFAARACGTDCPPNCGNGRCDDGETLLNCAQDCLSSRLDVIVRSPEQNLKVNRGDEIQLKVSVMGEGKALAGAKVTAGGFFGRVELLDDGQHSDGAANDGTYAGTVVVPDNSTGMNLVEFETNYGGFSDLQYVAVNVIGALQLDVVVGGPYALGDAVSINGRAVASGKPAAGESLLELYPASGRLVHSEKKTFTGGGFSFSYHSTLEDELGNWTVRINVTDLHGNAGSWTGRFLMTMLPAGSYLDVEHIGPVVGVYRRGSAVSVTARVKRDGTSVSGATVLFVAPDGSAVEMKEVGSGVYGIPYRIKSTDPLGSWTIITKASLKTDSGIIEGSSSHVVSIAPSQLQIEIIRPERGEFSIGDTVEVLASVKYPDGEPMTSGQVTLVAGGSRIHMEPAISGSYVAYYTIGGGREGETMLSVEADDGYSNSGSKAFMVLVKGTSVLFLLDSYKVVLIPALFALCVVLFTLVRKRFGHNRKEKLLQRKGEIMELQMKLQTAYLKEGSVDRKTFYDMGSKYDSELQKIDNELEEIKEK